MKRVLKQACIFLALLLIFTIVRFPYDSYSPDIVRAIKSRASSQGLLVDIESLHLKMPPAVQFKNLGVLIPNAGSLPVPFLIDTGRIRLALLPVALLRAQLEGDFSLYSGSGRFILKRSLWDGSAELDLGARELEIERHPLFSGIGMRGLLELNAKGKVLGTARQEGTTEVTLREGEYAGGMLQGLVKIPQISDISLSFKGRLKGRELIIEGCELLSSVGSASCRGSGELTAQGQLLRFNGNASIKLIGEGVSAFSGYLALLANRDPSIEERNWTINWSFDGKRMKTTAQPG